MDSFKERFDAKWSPEPNSGCWLWTASVDGHGYGKIFKDGRLQKAHRVAYELYKSKIPDGLLALHHCDNRLCINPDHIFIGTQRDNMIDKCAKGRGNGEKHPMAKLSDAHALEIKQSKEPLKVLAERFSVSIATISRIRNGKKWKHIGK